MERRFAVLARAPHQKVIAALAALVLASGPALAAPKTGEARVQFDRGVAAYTKGDYASAAEALGASFVLEADPETLFAWAQTERKLGHCDRAIDLYTKLLAMDMPAENKQAIQVQIDECKAIVAEDKTRPAEPVQPITPVSPQPATQQPPPPRDEPAQPERRAWWKDPVGGGLVGAGAIGLGVGVVFLVQGRNADADKDSAPTYPEYEVLADRAESRGRLGVIGIAAGSALIAGGVIWYVTRKPAERTTVTTLVLPSGGGVALSGRF